MVFFSYRFIHLFSETFYCAYHYSISFTVEDQTTWVSNKVSALSALFDMYIVFSHNMNIISDGLSTFYMAVYPDHIHAKSTNPW